MGKLTWHVPQRDSRKHLTYPVLNTPRLTGANVAGGSCRTLSECCLCTMLHHWFFLKSPCPIRELYFSRQPRLS